MDEQIWYRQHVTDGIAAGMNRSGVAEIEGGTVPNLPSRCSGISRNTSLVVIGQVGEAGPEAPPPASEPPGEAVNSSMHPCLNDGAHAEKMTAAER